MAEQEGLRSSEKMASLVLSIFKGENFVVKGFRTPCRVYLKAKCADLQPELALDSGAVELTSAITEPEFNSQLAWSLSRKQLKELRSNRSIIKVTCFVTDRNGTETEIGYVVLHVKDATAFGPGVDVDPTKALTFPLLGTKDYWRTLQPKLQMILHLEDVTPEKRVQIQPNAMNHNANTRESNKPAHNQPETELGIKNAAQLSETKLLPLKDTNKFVWTIRETDGYFQLGNVAEDDDLYIINTTVISASYLHSLWDGKSPRKRTSDNYFWQIKYEVYGCEIASDPFLLGDEDESRRTFVGDKATARIRTNGALFFEYLQETNLQFQIIRYQLGPSKQLTNPEVMGVCFASLSELTNPNKREHRECMEILSEWGTPRVSSNQGKPEVRVLFGLEAIPNYFKICDSSALETNNNIPLPPEIRTTDRNSGNARLYSNHRHSPIVQTNSNDEEVNIQNVEEKHEDVPDGASTADMDFDAISNNSNARRLLQFEGQTRQDGSPPPSSSVLTSPERRIPDKHKFSQPSNSNLSESEDSENTSNKENLARIMPPLGEYNVTIELNRFWLKSKRIITDNFLLSYTHPPLGLSDKPVECYSQPLEPDLTETRHGFIIPDGQFTKTVSITKFSEKLLNDPLTVEFYRTVQDAKSRCFASAMIPFGRIFSEKGHNNVWIMEDSSDVLKLGQNVKIGTLFYKIKLMRQSSPERRREKTTTNQRHSSFFPPPSSQTNKPLRSSDEYARDGRDHDKMKKISDDMREWRHTQEEMLKKQKEEKETAYLKILSEEATKRDAEREHVLAKKLAELEKKEKELNRQRRTVEEKEDRLKQLDNELKDKARKLALEQETLQQQSSLTQRRLEEDHKIEVEGLKRRIRGFQDEAEKLKTKVLLLEKKLETKEAEIDNLMALKRELPDARLEQRVSLLEQENKTLKIHLRDANGRKEQYKKQSLALCQKLNRLQEERDQELKDQNENLRLQILASKEHKELKKERKAVQDLSQTLKALQKETISPSNTDGQGDRTQAHNSNGPIRKSRGGIKGENSSKVKEDEIKRLAAERNKLLQTGAYTNYDSVIKELERKMVSLAQE